MKKEGKEEKNKETKPVYILETPGAILLQFGMWGTDSGGISTAKIVRFCKSSTKVHVLENCIIVLSFNILTRLRTSFLSRMTYYCVS